MKGSIIYLVRKLGLLPLAERLRFVLLQSRHRKANTKFRRSNPNLALPPDYLVYETYRLNLQEYFDDGKVTAHEMADIINLECNLTTGNLNVLDWGCGPGRVVRHLPEILSAANVYATDYNSEYVNWCTTHLPDVNCTLNGVQPPLKYPDNFFDAIIGLSIFTHLSIANHSEWLKEFQRILKPAGILILTTHGEAYRRKLLTRERLKFDNNEPVVRENVMEGNRLFAVFQPPKWMHTLGLLFFEEVKHQPAPLDKVPGQDVWVFKHPRK